MNLTETFTPMRQTSGVEDRYGNATDTYVDGAPLPCRLEQVDAQERENAQVTEWRLFLPGDADLEGVDRGRHDTEGEFAVIGEPAKRRTPRGVHHQEARLRRFT